MSKMDIKSMDSDHDCRTQRKEVLVCSTSCWTQPMTVNTIVAFFEMVSACFDGQSAVGLVVFVCLLSCLQVPLCLGKTGDQLEDSRLTYEKLLKFKHAEQLKATKSILAIGDYTKQHKMITLIYNKMFEIVSGAKNVLESSGYVHGDNFPTNTTVRDALSTTVENTLFFSNILLHLPDINHKILSNKKEWRLLLQWSWQLCNEMPYLDKQMSELLRLAGQEIGFIEMEPNYVNPFKSIKEKESISSSSNNSNEVKRKKKREKVRGPRMSSAGEL